MAAKPDHPPLIVIVGETASGKTATAIKLARQVNGEIICADSRTVYRHMDIGTAKPTTAEQNAVTHHLIDVVTPNQSFSAVQFKRLAQKCIQAISQSGKTPIMVGGSGLYIDSILYDLQFGGKPDYSTRVRLEQMSDEELTTFVQAQNISLGGVSIKNRRHLVRAIERGGTPEQEKVLRPHTLVLGLQVDREVLKKRIARRVQQMFVDGLVLEVEALRNKYGKDISALDAPGYKAVGAYLEGQITLEEAQQLFIKNDLHLAKRQRTWFKRNPHIQWVTQSKQLLTAALKFQEQFKV